jgi:acyl-phosphate glycerol 3-phosphate acyltransferase
MNPLLPSTIAVLAAYLVGSVPTAYLIVRAVKGIDIRTVGSGNVGATNAGRVLGRSYFLLVFVLDLLKGALPTWGFPPLAERLAGVRAPGLAIFVAAAAIVGHNFPIFLGFRGGKGVATSLGAVLAIDPRACLAAAVAFVVVLAWSRFVSLSSITGAVVFVVAHFAFERDPWARDRLATNAAIMALAALLIWRHRSNLVRIARGTEPRIGTRRTSHEYPDA